MFPHLSKLYLATALFALCAGSMFAQTAVVAWDNQALQAIRDTHPGPPIVARMLAITHTCAYDAWTAYDAKAVGTRLAGTLRRPAGERNDANKQKAISYAAYRCLVDLFPQPAEQPLFTGQMTAFGYDPNDTSTDITTPQGIGNVAAAAVIAFRHHDGANQLGDLNPGPYTDYTGYTPVNTPFLINNPDRWQPLQVPNGQGGFVIQNFIAPFWGKVAPFAISNVNLWVPPFPPASNVSNPAFYQSQAQQILDYSANLTDTQKVIAEYWADGPKSELPPGHWCLFSQFVSARDHHNLDQDAKMFFAVTNGILDASIVSWQTKRFYDSVRPVTAVHFLFSGQQVLAWAGPGLGTQLIDGANWRPYQAATVVTPPFPEYISGHSIFSATGAEILKDFTGSDNFGNSFTNPAGVSRVEPGITPAHDVTLSWPTFSDAANEAGISRRYGGIHFAEGDIVGRFYGRLVGKNAWAKAQTYFNGTAH